jgi:soluble lytic murein transglycosylase
VLHVVLDDPRFTAAREKERARDFAGAAAELAIAGARPELDARTHCQVAFVEGRMRTAAADAPAAADAFDRASATTCPLAPYAALRAAQAWGRQGKADEAIARAKTALVASPDVIVLDDDASLVLAEALAAKGQRAEAVPLWRKSLATHPKGSRWVDTSVRLATALLDGVDGDVAAHAKEAQDAVMRVELEAPTYAESSGASTARTRAAVVLHAPLDLGPTEKARRAQAWLDAGKLDKAQQDAQQALGAARPLGTKPGAEGDTALVCRIQTILAQLAARTKGKPADAWGTAITACAAADPKGDALGHALFAGAKASWSAKRDVEALERFARIERELPDQRYADDARLLAALVHLERGEPAEFYSALEKLPDDYPKGDMKVEALFRVALQKLQDKDYAGVRAVLARAEPLDAGNSHWATAGRVGYFAARAAQLAGDVAQAKDGYAAVVRAHPMAFYMFESYARLAALDAGLAKRTLDEAAHAEPAGRWLTHEHDAMKKPAFARALALLEVGEIDAARKELTACGALAEGAEAELVWTVAALFDRAGAYDVGHSFSRARLGDHLAHFPEGRWRNAWEAAYPKAYEDLVRRAATERGIPFSLAWAIMREESAFIVDVRSPTGALGLMQLMPQTAKEVARGTTLGFDEESLKRADTNIALGTKLLGTSRTSYGPAAAVLAVPAYNAGPGAVGRWLASRPGPFDVWVELIPFEETRGYVKRVLASQGTYAWLYAPGELAEVLGLPEKVGGP